MAKLIIIRGLPGSGKSTYAKEHFPTLPLYETDMFFTIDGEYKWNKDYISFAHNWCYTNVIKCLISNQDVVVANTFTTKWELANYLDLKDNIPSTEIHIIEMKTQYESIHNVPKEHFLKMKQRWEELPYNIKNMIATTFTKVEENE